MLEPISYKFEITEIIEEGKVKHDDITQIRLWLKNVNLPKITDETIVTFLIACKHDVACTKNAITANFHSKLHHPEIFKNRIIDSDELVHARNTVFHASIPCRTDDDCVIHFFRINDTRYYNFHLNQVAKLCFMLVDISLNSKSPPKGLKVVIDAKGAGLMHLTRFKLKTLRTMIEFLQEGMPLNMIEIHVLNTILMVDKLIFMIKPFMKPELYKMLNLHPNNTNLDEFSEKFIPKKCLPFDYGGDLPSLEELNQRTIEQYRELESFFKVEEELIENWSETLSNVTSG